METSRESTKSVVVWNRLYVQVSIICVPDVIYDVVVRFQQLADLTTELYAPAYQFPMATMSAFRDWMLDIISKGHDIRPCLDLGAISISIYLLYF